VDTVRMPGGRETRREIVEHSDCVAIVAIDADDKVLLVKQFRKAVEKELLEIPAGGIDPGEDPVAAVRRELQEETGYLPRKVERLGGFYSTPGYGTEYLHLYLAADLVPSQLHAEDTGSIEVVAVALSEISSLIASGDICDAKSIAGLPIFMEYEKVFNYPSFEDCKKILDERMERKTKLRMYAYEITGQKVDEKTIKKGFIEEIENQIEREMTKIKEQIIKDKLKRFEIIIREVQDAVHSTYLRAWNGQERRTLRQHTQITEVVGNHPTPLTKHNKGVLGRFRG
ncbi:hypothetical protein LCGC14_1294530, partial [marine sediment metagenome]